MTSPHPLLLRCFQAALAAVDPLNCLRAHLPPPPVGRVIVLGAGKAAARMARTLELAWPQVALEGLVITRYGHSDDCQRIEVLEAAHPVPDAAGLAGAQRMLALAQTAQAGDTVIALISGGGSSLLSLPVTGLEFQEKQRINKALLASGAPIHDMNVVRSCLSAIKGGRLGLACGQATVHTLVLSDVPGDNPAVVASGPTIAGLASGEKALSILKQYNVQIPRLTHEIIQNFKAPANALGPRHVRVIATANHALSAATAVAVQAGWQVTNLGAYLEGEARELGRMHAGLARELFDRAQATRRPQLLLSGGETTVTVRHEPPGKGGRNSEFLLGALLANTTPGLHALAVDTDGIDGSEDNAGAFFGPDTALTGAQSHLSRHDAHGFFESAASLLVTGPTRTNVNDFRAFAIEPPITR